MPVPCALSAVLSRNRASAAVALPTVLGLRIVEFMATHSSNTPGPRVSKLANVGRGRVCLVTKIVLSNLDVLLLSIVHQ